VSGEGLWPLTAVGLGRAAILSFCRLLRGGRSRSALPVDWKDLIHGLHSPPMGEAGSCPALDAPAHVHVLEHLHGTIIQWCWSAQGSRQGGFFVRNRAS
jgi:hypothetical protein